MRTPEADRFRHEVEVPEPPLSPKGRQRYWDETVFEAVAELRKRLRSGDSEVALEALQMILDLEKTRIRHGKQLSGTHVPNLPDLEDDWGRPVKSKTETSPPVALSMNGEGVFKPEAVKPEAHPSVTPHANRPNHEGTLNTPSPFARMPDLPGRPGIPAERGPGDEVFSDPPAEVFIWPPARALCPIRIPGVTGCFSDRDDDGTRDPGRADAAPFAYPYDFPCSRSPLLPESSP